MTAAKEVMDVIARLPGCDRQAPDAVSAYTQVQIGGCSQISKKSKIRMSRLFGYVFHDTHGQNHGGNFEDPVVPLERNLYGHPLAGLRWERQFEEALSEPGWEKIPNWECMFVNRKQAFLLSFFRG